METPFPSWFALMYFGYKYIIAALFIWFSIHYWVKGDLGGETIGYDMRPWLNRYPAAMVGLGFSLGALMLYAMSHVKAEYLVPYLRLLMVGEPFLYSWSAIATIVVFGSAAVYLYSHRLLRLGGMASMIAVMLTALVVPYYSMALLR